MAGLMVIELHDRAKRILKENLNSLQSMEPSAYSALYFKWCDDPPAAFQSSQGSSLDHESQFVLAIANLSENRVGFLVALIAKGPTCRID